MPIDVEWDNSLQTILRCELKGAWTWEELMDVLPTTRAMVSQMQHIVHVIAVFDGTNHAPMNAFPFIKKAMGNRSPNIGIVLLVNCHPIGKAVIRSFSMVYKNIGSSFAFVDSLEEARVLLKEEIRVMSKPIAVSKLKDTKTTA